MERPTLVARPSQLCTSTKSTVALARASSYVLADRWRLTPETQTALVRLFALYAHPLNADAAADVFRHRYLLVS